MDTFTLNDLLALLGACVVLGLVSAFGPALWHGVKAMLDLQNPQRPLWQVVHAALTSSVEDDQDEDQSLLSDNSPATTSPQNDNNGIAITQSNSNVLLRTQAHTLAIMVKAGKVGETEGIRLIFGCAPSSSNPKYLTARQLLKEELAKMSGPQFVPLDDKKQPLLN